jgi:hypothetical protein
MLKPVIDDMKKDRHSIGLAEVAIAQVLLATTIMRAQLSAKMKISTRYKRAAVELESSFINVL